MKNQLTIPILVLAATICLVWWHLHQRNPVNENGSNGISIFTPPATTTSGNPPAVQQTSTPTPLQQTSLAPKTTPPLVQMDAATRVLHLQQDVAAQNMRVDFYGMIIDQNNQPVVDAQVVMNVRFTEYAQAKGATSTFPKKQISTDANGRFSWTEGNGDILSIESIVKNGYLLATKTARTYKPSDGSLENPVVFKMWKLGKSQMLNVYHLSRIGIPADGQPIRFDLLNGKKVPSGGQLILRVERNPQILPDHSKYDWTIGIEIPNGGLIKNDFDFAYLAPEGGYEKEYKFQMLKTDENWKSVYSEQFYIQLENGKYFGSLSFYIPMFHSPPPVVLTLDVAINPNGSRDLQP